MSTAALSAIRTTRSAADTNKWLVLVIVCLAQFMVILDATIVNVALPSIQHGLKFSQENLQWVVNAYTLIFGGFLLLGGRAGDLIGRKRLFLAGLIVFSCASLLNALSQSAEMLILGRGLQGLGGALVSPAALSVLTTTFQEGAERTRAMGVWSGIAAGGGAVGLLAGGILTSALSWQWIFFVNAPIGVIAFLLALRYVPESTGNLSHRSFDFGGAISVTAGLVLLVFTIVKAQSFGWTSGKTIGLFAVSLILLIAFVVIELRTRYPLVRLRIFTIRPLATGDAVLLLVASGLFAMFFFASLYVQEILGYGALKAGFAFLPVAFGIGVGAGIAQQMVRRVGLRPVLTFGLALATIGMLVLVRLPVHGSYLTDLMTGLMPISIGMGFAFVAITLLATSGVEHQDAGLASGLFNTAQQVGGALGLAILSTLAANATGSALGKLHHPARAIVNQAQLNGFHVAFAAGAILMAAGIVIELVVLRKRDVERIEAEPSLAAA
jgi:EmrB/QacA subfamily drug resistance transporter